MVASFFRGLRAWRVLCFFSLASTALCQLPSVKCDSVNRTLAVCPFLTHSAVTNRFWDHDGREMLAAGKMPENETGDAFVSVLQHARSQGFNWRRALSESFAFLAIERAYVIHHDYRLGNH